MTMLENKTEVKRRRTAMREASLGISIKELTEVNVITSNDFLVIEKEEGGTAKISATVLSNEIKVADDFTGGDVKTALSANKGKELNDGLLALQKTVDVLPTITSGEKLAVATIGDATTLTTTEKTSIVGAVNEINGEISTLKGFKESSELAIGNLSFAKITQAEYDELATKNADTIYFIV